MPNYTTSYSSKKKPRYRASGAGKLKFGAARPKPRRRRSGQYLRHTQGFSSRGMRGGHGYGGNSRKPYAIIVVGAAFLLFVASIIWYANRSVDITLNGEAATARINITIKQFIEGAGLDLKAGNLLSVDDSVLEKGGGEPYTVKLDGKKLGSKALADTQIKGGEKLEVADGGDVYEDHDVKATAIPCTLKVTGTGAIQYVKTWGEDGRSEVWTGKVSGKTKDRGVVKKAVTCEIVRASVAPSSKDKKYVALTFDEGPSQFTGDILSILEEKGVKATFFLTGEAIANNADAVKQIADVGCELGSNGYSDASLAKLSGDKLRDELSRGFNAIKSAGGGRATLLRPSAGEFSTRNWAEGMDLVGAVVSWNVDSGDWLLKGAQNVVDTVMGSVQNGNIVLLTDNDATGEQTLEALPSLIDELQADGYTILTVSKLIETDKDLAKAVSAATAGMPEDASLPQVSKESGAAAS